jgi:DNA-binding CsgD family transcriptional regulator
VVTVAGLLERERELVALQGAIDAARAARGTVVLIEAPAGVGKSALLSTASDLARRDGMRVLTARGAPLERGLGFGVARQLLAPHGGGSPAGMRTAAAGLFGRAGVPERLPPDETPGLIQALSELVADLVWPAADRATATPLVLAVDDAQWADRSSLRFLGHLALRLDELPLLLIAAIRSGESGTPEELDHLRTLPLARSLHPSPLSEGAVAQFVREQLDERADVALCRACAHATGGNPFYLHELLLAIRAEGASPPSAAEVERAVPESVLRSVLVRLARLGSPATRLASAVAVLGDGATLQLAAALAGLDANSAEQAADTLAAADLLAPGEPLRFAHPLIASALEADMGAFERARAHRRAADLIAAQRAGPELVAMHLLHARPEGDAGVLQPLRAAAALARERGQPEEAVRLLRRALDEPPPPELRADVLVELAAAGAVSASPDAIDQLEEALELIDDPRRRAEALHALSVQLHHASDFARAATMAERAAAELPPDDPLQPRLLAARVGSSVVQFGLRGEAQAALEPLLEAARAGEAPNDPGLLALMAFRMAEGGEPAERVRALADAALAGDPLLERQNLGTSVGFLAAALIWIDELALAERWLDRAVDEAVRANAVTALWIARYYRGNVHLLRGRLADAIADAESALQLYRYGWAASPGSTVTLARAQLERGNLEASRQAIAIGEQADERRIDHLLLLEARAHVRLAEGDALGAFADARAAGGLAEAFGSASERGTEWRPLAAVAAHKLGRVDEAREIADEALERTRGDDSRRVRGRVLRAAGVVTDGERGLELLTEAVGLLDESPAVLERTHALVELGAALRRAGRRRHAKDTLLRALELADQIDAAALAERTRGELRGLGLRPRRGARTGPAALTPSERQIAGLAAAGQSTPQIAHHLTITKKTVETHLAHVYRKLGIRSRAELADALADRGGATGL